MFFHAQWEGPPQGERRTSRITTPYGPVEVWFAGGDLAILFRVEQRKEYAMPGILLAISDQLRERMGASPTLKLTPVPAEWLRSDVLPFFAAAGFRPELSVRTLQLQSKMPGSEALAKAAVVSFALDPISRSQPELFSKARQLALSLHLDETILSLFEDRRGAYRLRDVFGKNTARKENPAQVQAIISSLQKMKTRTVVHFECDGGWLFREIAKFYPLERAIGVEPSKRRAAGTVTGFELVHGSLVEPPGQLPLGSTALLLNALPRPGDLRLDRAAETLFRKIGFEWVLCLEREPVFGGWAETAAEKYGYRFSPVAVGDSQGFLFRRSPTSCPRTGVHPRSSPEIMTALGTTVRAEAGSDTLEAFSKLTVDPRWLIYLPPETATLQNKKLDGDLEDPKLAFDYYRSERITKLVVHAKPLGSRAIAILCRDEESAEKRFGIRLPGCIYTRTGRPFFADTTLVDPLREALCRADFWEHFQTDWVCLDGQVLPWKMKASEVLEKHRQVLEAGEAMYEMSMGVLNSFGAESRIMAARKCFQKYRMLYERYAALSAEEILYAPVSLIAVEGRSFFGMTNLWQMETINALVRKAGAPFIETPYKFISLDNPMEVSGCLNWWRQNAAVVIKPLPFLPKRRGWVQPGFLCREREHIRFVYGPEYDLPEKRLWLSQHESLEERKAKRKKVLKQLALSMAAVERFVSRQPIERVEECVRGVLSLG
jgi:hypothetical protein